MSKPYKDRNVNLATQTAYARQWRKDHPGYSAAQSAKRRKDQPATCQAEHARATRRPRTRFNQGEVHAKRRGWLWTIPYEQWLLLVAPGTCHYCKGPLNETGHGLDRRDNTKGYEEHNVVPCCLSCNWVKGHLECAGFAFPRTEELLLELIQTGRRTVLRKIGRKSKETSAKTF